MAKKKNITIDELGAIVQKGFSDAEIRTEKRIDDLAVMVQEGFNGVDKRFQRVEEKLAEHDQRFQKIDERFERVDDSLTHIGSRLGCIEADINAMRGEVVLRTEFDDVLARVKYLEKKLNIESGK